MDNSRYAYANIVLRQVGHDLKSPLTAIIGTLEALYSLGSKLSDAQKEMLCKTGIKEAYRLQHFIQNILMIGRIENDGLELNKTSSPLKKSLDGLQVKLKQQHPHVTFQTAVNDDVNVLADPKWFDEALWQILDNVGRHNPNTPVTCIINTAQNDNNVVLSIHDNGVGIDDNLKPTVFDKHVKGSATMHHDASAGVGLTLAQMIVKAHEGQLALDNNKQTPGAGLLLTLPQ